MNHDDWLSMHITSDMTQDMYRVVQYCTLYIIHRIYDTTTSLPIYPLYEESSTKSRRLDKYCSVQRSVFSDGTTSRYSKLIDR